MSRTQEPVSAAVIAVPGLHVRTEPSVVHVDGDVDAATAPAFRTALEICDSDPLVHSLDLSNVEFFSAAGVRCLVELEWPTRPHPQIVASRSVRRVLEICRLEFLLAPHGWEAAFDGWCTPRTTGRRSDEPHDG